MNAPNLLRQQGWLGSGHSLDIRGKGVKKPLLISRKANTFGLGKKKIDVHADQWWARAFDEGLKNLTPAASIVDDNDGNITTGESGQGGKGGVGKEAGMESIEKGKSARVGDLAMLAKGGRKWMGLYRGFVKGTGLEGTIEPGTGSGAGGRTGVGTGVVIRNDGLVVSETGSTAQIEDRNDVEMTSQNQQGEDLAEQVAETVVGESKAERRQRRANKREKRRLRELRDRVSGTLEKIEGSTMTMPMDVDAAVIRKTDGTPLRPLRIESKSEFKDDTAGTESSKIKKKVKKRRQKDEHVVAG